MNTEQERADLLPCPFCGDTDIGVLGGTISHAECGNCGARGPTVIRDTQAASHWWNARAALQSQDREDAERLAWLLNRLPGDAIRYCVGELADTADMGEFREAIDHARRIEGMGRTAMEKMT